MFGKLPLNRPIDNHLLRSMPIPVFKLDDVSQKVLLASLVLNMEGPIFTVNFLASCRRLANS